MTRIYFVRHGESIGNRTRTFTGGTDLGLTDVGFKQAESASKFFEETPVEKIYASPLSRAYDTAVPTAKLLGLPIEVSCNMREIYGGLWEKMPFADIARIYPELNDTFTHDIGRLVPPEGESVAEVSGRVIAELRRIAEESPGKNIAVFTHAIPIRSVVTYLSGIPAERMGEVAWVANASVTEVLFDETNNSFTLGRVDIRKHLGGSETSLSDVC